ncbi:TPA: hypothetical protein I7740_04050 [Vibrio vulnificus]|nr:hypothetical protein [Vibrio vulnificus]
MKIREVFNILWGKHTKSWWKPRIWIVEIRNDQRNDQCKTKNNKGEYLASSLRMHSKILAKQKMNANNKVLALTKNTLKND